MLDKEFITKMPEETFELGQKFCAYVLKNSPKKMPKVGFKGGLGAGKTVFIKGFVEAFIPGAEVTSPTYTIMNDYVDHKKVIYHVDLYRINSLEDLLGTGFFEAFEDPKTIMLLEWSERLPKAVDFTVDIRHVSDIERGITISKGVKV